MADDTNSRLCSVYDVTQMVTCDLSYQNLDTFPTDLSRLNGVQVLYLTGNKLRTIPKWIDKLDELRELHLDDNLFEEFPSNVCELKNLQQLTLNSNKLNSLPKELVKLEHLKILSLAWNEFSHFPGDLLNLHNLEVLFLGDNFIESIPLNIGAMVKLEELWINRNKISELPSTIYELSNLKRLWAYGNCIKYLPPKFARCLSKLESLRVYGNPLVEPPHEVVNLGVEAIKNYEDEIERTSRVCDEQRLKMVVLGEARAGKTSLISTLISNQSKLTEIENRTHCIDVMKWCTEKGLICEIYDFGGHQAYSLTHQFFLSPHSLNVLVFDLHTYTGKHFDKMISYWLDVLQSRVPGSVVCLVGTHVDLCTPDEVKQKCQDVLQRVRGMRRRQIQDINIQMSVLDSAINENIRDSPSKTISEVTIDTLRKRKIQLKFLRLNQLQIDNTIHTVSSTSSMAGIDHLRTYIAESADDVNKFPGLQRVLPSTWFQLEMTFLRDSGRHRYSMPWSRCVAMGHKCGLDEERLQSAVQHLHQIGSVLHFDHLPELREYVFPHPVRLIDVFKDIFHHDLETLLDHSNALFQTQYTQVKFRQVRTDLTQRGLMSFRFIRLLTSKHLTTDSEVKLMLRLMETFGICFSLPNTNDDRTLEGNIYRFPWYLRDRKPSEPNFWPKEKAPDTEHISLRCQIQGFCPPGIFERLCVLINRHISPSYREDWRNGVCGYSSDGLATFLLDYSSEDGATEIGVSTRGTMTTVGSMWEITMALFEELRQLLREWPGVLHDWYILCPHCVNKESLQPEVFPGEFLTRPRPRSVIRVPCPSGLGTVDAALVYPSILDRDDQESKHFTNVATSPSSGTLNRADVRGSGSSVIQTGPYSTINVGCNA
ncbi:malignant fibrous histiocytoma-amplified sequence 1 homolog [Glandiceps talaboti]